MEKLKLLLGGSPCTHWSIAQTKDRETEPSGIGWELFQNYRIARDKYKPDYFLYENNKSMSPAIKAQITKELGVEPVLINSALVSAQSRQRLYWFGKRNPDGTYSQVPVEQPEDRGILLRDVLESGVCWRENAYTMRANYGKQTSANMFGSHFPAPMVAEPVCINHLGSQKSRTIDAHMGNLENNLVPRISNENPAKQQYDCIAEPVRIGTIESGAKNTDFDSQQYRVYSPDGKSVTLCGNGGGVGAKTGPYAVPIGETLAEEYYQGGFYGDLIGMIENPSVCRNGKQPSQQYRVYSCDGKSVCVDTDQRKHYIVPWDGKTYPVYHVQDGLITIKDKQYPIKLADGYYIIRKLTATECKRLQTVPEGYLFPVSDTQAYKMLGNGWTVDVIAHILSHIPGITTEPLEVLSMYDGMSCGHIALDKLGANVVQYYATEIDKYAIKTAQTNYPATMQLGDAFQVRDDGWTL